MITFTFDILVSIRGVTIRGVTIRGVTESGDNQYDFHYLYFKPMMQIVLGVMGSIEPHLMTQTSSFRDEW